MQKYTESNGQIKCRFHCIECRFDSVECKVVLLELFAAQGIGNRRSTLF
jgi:hypothetical protein